MTFSILAVCFSTSRRKDGTEQDNVLGQDVDEHLVRKVS